MLADAERRTGTDLGKPWLIALSAGGPAGFEIYNAAPDSYAAYICLASVPTADTARALRKDVKILMLNGTEDAKVPIAAARKRVQSVRRRVPCFRFHSIKGNHFFLLSNRKDTFKSIDFFMAVDAKE